MSVAPARFGPIAPAARISALDAARGFALLGIFLVNIQAFGEPFGRFIELSPPGASGTGEVIAYYFVKIFCESKFFPLFSTLFGIGLILQMGRADAAGRGFALVYLRRLTVLLAMGLCHALLFWYGDILFIYALAGAVLLIFARASAGALLAAAIALIGFSLLLTSVFAVLTLAKPGPAPPAAAETPAGVAGAPADAPSDLAPVGPAPAAPGSADQKPRNAIDAPFFTTTPYGRLLKALSEQKVQEPQNPLWIETETEAYRDGPWLQAFLFRGTTWLMVLIASVMGFGWHVLAMFFIGAALMKRGVFDEANAHLARRLLLAGICIGLPLSAAGAFLPRLGISAGVVIGMTALNLVGGTLVALGYLGGMIVLVRSGVLACLAASCARVGRVALTNYLCQTLIATTIFYWYGLGLFGETTRVQRVGMVLAIYAAQHVLSWLWLSAFAIGPAEWVWRSLTYLRPQPLLRRPVS